MSVKDAFAAEDWIGISALPMLVGMTVTAADPGGLWGALKESTAMAGAIARAGSAGDNALIAAVAGGFAAPEVRGAVTDMLKDQVKGRKPAEIVDSLVGEVARLAALIDSKAPEAAPGFKAWLYEVATSVAEAGTEGGFLGFGGVKVSPEEKATLERLSTALALPAATV